MRRVLIPDSGPLFSLAAGNLLGILGNLSLVITDVVKEETFDQGLSATCSTEASRLLSFFQRHAEQIQIVQTQVGLLLETARLNPQYVAPRNTGELSIQSYLIDLAMAQAGSNSLLPIVLFEDAWFLRNAASLAKPCILMSTQAFLLNAEKLGLIKSAAAAREAIVSGRPDANKIFYQQAFN